MTRIPPSVKRGLKPVKPPANSAHAEGTAVAASHVLRLLAQHEPCTTRALHERLKSPSSDRPLPRQPVPNMPPRQRIPTSRTQIVYDGANPDHDPWSMAFLKRRVLASLVESHDVVKLHRDKWASVAGTAEAGRERSKDESDWVWVTAKRWEELMARKKREEENEGARERPKEVKEGLKRLKRDEGTDSPWA
ncbi:uncharacterized protein JCM10292_006490 [Rhodotorula paludigena]|uniref:uncharacterized protein n=1 Tax=Rhodotorula paludigena TaxID=86838 RepID=UPI00316C8F84